MGRRRGILAAMLAAVAVGLAACGSAGVLTSVSTDPGGVNNPNQPAPAELASAVTNLGAGTTLMTTVSSAAPIRMLGRIAARSGASLAPGALRGLAGARLSLEVVAPKGKTIGELTSADAESASVDLAVRSGATTYVELRTVDQTLYLRVDLKDLLAEIGQSARYAALAAKAAGLSNFAKALVGGQWVAIPAATLSLLRSLRGGGLGDAPSPSPSSTPAPVNAIAQLRTLLTHGVRVTRTASGSTDQLVMGERLGAFVTEIRTVLRTAVPLAGMGRLGRPLAGVRARLRERGGRAPARALARTDIRVHAAVREGALSSLSVNLGQLAQRQPVSWPVQVAFARTGPAITAPDGAVSLDASDLLGLMSLSGVTGAGGTGGLQGGLAGLGGLSG